MTNPSIKHLMAGAVLAAVAVTALPAAASNVAIVKGGFYTSYLHDSLVAAGETVTEISSYSAASLAAYDAVIHYGNSFTDTVALDAYVNGGGRLILTPWSGLNYAVPAEILQPYLPPGVELDRWQGNTYASLVGFQFLDTRVLGIRDDTGQEVRVEDLPGQTLVAVAGLARPEAFFATLRGLGIAPARAITFRDHDPYGPFAMGRIEREAEESGATAVVTTEKDAVKLEGRLRLPLFRVAVEMAVAENDFVEDALRRLARPPS